MRVARHQGVDPVGPREVDEVLTIGIDAQRLRRRCGVLDEDALAPDQLDVGIDLRRRYRALELGPTEDVAQLG